MTSSHWSASEPLIAVVTALIIPMLLPPVTLNNKYPDIKLLYHTGIPSIYKIYGILFKNLSSASGTV